MQTPSATFTCPRCRHSFDKDTPFCGQCGADMRHASRLDMERPQGAPARRKRGTMTKRPPDRRVQRDHWLGKLIDNRYLVEEVIGRGGMGVVYKIKHQRMGKIAAMKVLHSELAGRSEVVARFQREAEAVSRLAHPNTVQVFDFGAVDGALYLVMEYVRGQDLGALIDRDGPMSFLDAAPLLGQICGSLEEAHDLGVVHRDLKPENILVSRTHSGHDFVKVLDFGLAKLSEGDEASTVTSDGSIVGTPYYMSPEQIRAEEELDQRADIYSFGALLYRMLTADNAFNAKNPVGVLTKHLTEPLIPPGQRYPGLEIPPELDRIVARCMEKSAQDRYPSIRKLLEDIDQLHGTLASETSDVRLPPTSFLANTSGNVAAAVLVDDIDHGLNDDMRLRREDLDHFERGIRRRRVMRSITLPLLLLGIGAGAYFAYQWTQAPKHEESEPNNKFSDATLVVMDADIKGYLGKRQSKTEPDRDFFRFDKGPDLRGTEVLNVSVTAPPNMDVRLEVYTDEGQLLTEVDDHGIGEPETLRRWRFRGDAVIAVAGLMEKKPGILPTENVSDPYTLHASIAPIDPRLESEPNNSAADAIDIAPSQPVTAHLDHASDEDNFRFTGPDGEYRLLISGGPEKPFEWQVRDSETWQRNFEATVKLSTGQVLRVRYVPDEAFEIGHADAVPYTLSIGAP